MRVVSLESPLKGHQPLYVFNFIFLILNIWKDFKVLSSFMQKWSGGIAWRLSAWYGLGACLHWSRIDELVLGLKTVEKLCLLPLWESAVKTLANCQGGFLMDNPNLFPNNLDQLAMELRWSIWSYSCRGNPRQDSNSCLTRQWLHQVSIWMYAMRMSGTTVSSFWLSIFCYMNMRTQAHFPWRNLACTIPTTCKNRSNISPPYQ